MLVSQILKSKADLAVVTISSGATIAEAAALLSERRIGALIVSKNGKYAEGILSERDIVREIGKRGPAVLGEKVAALMTKKLISCARGDKTDAVLQMMTDGRFRHMPVMEGAVRIGIISIGDVVKARIEQVEREADEMRAYIALA